MNPHTSNNELLCLCTNRLKQQSTPSSTQAFGCFVVYYNRTKMMGIWVPIGLGKLKITGKQKRIWAYFTAQRKSAARILHHEQFLMSPLSHHSQKQ